jgi:hypothetical protein
MAASIHPGCIPVLQSFGFSEEDITLIRKRRSLNIPSPGKLTKRIIAIRKGLSISRRNGALVRTVTMWPEILQYRNTRISLRIEELRTWGKCNRGQVVSMLRKHPTILGLRTMRLINVIRVLNYLGVHPAQYPNAFLINPEIIRGRARILHTRGEYDIPAGTLFQAGHSQFERRTRCDYVRVCMADPGMKTFLETSFDPPLRIVH